MRKVTRLACPKCNQEVPIARAKIKYTSDRAVAVCQNCGYTVTEEDMAAETRRTLERWNCVISKKIG